MTRSNALILCLGVCLILGGQGCMGLRMALHNSSTQKPSNVALYFSVETRDDQPVASVPAEAFKIYEDDQLISPFESKQTILNPEVAVVHHMVLLLDLSGSITESGSMPALVSAASAFAERITRSHQVAVFGFDGSPSLLPVVDFTNNPKAVQAGLETFSHWRAKDPSTNLNGAVVEAVKVLEGRLAKSTQPLRFATLVVFTDGTDRAHRVSEAAMLKVVEEGTVSVFVIGLGVDFSEKKLVRLGRNGFIRAADLAAVGKAFDEVAARIEASARKFYLLSYCSPARAGLHMLRVAVEAEGMSGELEQPFNADGFGPGCDPSTKPNFPIGKIRLH